MENISPVAQSRQRSGAMTFVVLSGPALGALMPLALVPSLPAIASHFGGSHGSAVAEAVIAVPALMVLVGSPFVAGFAERYGLRRCLIVSLLLYSLAGSAGLVATGTLGLLASRMLLGLSGAGILTLSVAMIANYYAGSMRERLYGLGSCIAAIVCAVVSTAGGWLVDTAGWRAPFSFYFLGLAVTAVAALMPKRSFIAPEKGKIAQKSSASIARLWPFYAVLTSLSVGLFVPYVDGPFLLDEATHSAGLLRGEIFSSMLALSAVSAAFFEVFAGRLGENRLLIIVALMLGSGEMMIARSHGIAALFCGFLTSGAASSLVMPTMTSIILQRVPLSGRSRAAGLIFSCVYLGQFLTPVVSSLLRTFLSRQGAVFSIGAALIVIVGVAVKTSSAFRRKP